MSARNPARLLAPLALVAVAVAFFLVLAGGGADGEQEAGPQPAATATATAAAKKSERRKERKRSTYVVKAGDTPSGIAEKVDLSVDELIELNPDLDAQSLNVGDRIKIK